MFSPVVPPPTHSQRSQKFWRLLLVPLSLWICVSVVVRYGYYGDLRMVLGPSSARLMQTSSVFVQQVEVRNEERKGAILYGFSEKPELSFERNWSVSSKYVIVASYSRKEFSLWLNKGSKVRMRWEAQESALGQLQMVMIKGERKDETLFPKSTSSSSDLRSSEPINGREAEYVIEEDDKYYLGVTNSNSRSIIMTVSLDVTSKMYNLTKAVNMCSTMKGSCGLKLQFPDTRYVVITTPDNGELGEDWYFELSFVARVITYIAILGFIILIIFLILKYFGVCDSEDTVVDTAVREVSETEPILLPKQIPITYGTNKKDEDDDGSSSSSSEDLYDAKLCMICYDDQRNCFFVPCGHCATCYDCAQRIIEGESKQCPFCRRLIHKVRRLFTP